MEEVFKAGAGATPNVVYLLIAGVGCSLIVIWAAWFSVSNFRGWAKGQYEDGDMAWNYIRAVMVIVVMFWIFL